MMDAKYWRSVLGGLLCAALTVAFPIVAITRGALQHINVLGWNERILINLAIVIGAITAGAAHKTILQIPSNLEEKTKPPKNWKEALQWLKVTISKNRAFLLLQLTVMLNTAAAVLCKRISATEIGRTSEIQTIVSVAGLVVFAAGGLLLGLTIIYRPIKASEKVVEVKNDISPEGNSESAKAKNTKKANGLKAQPLVQFPELSAWLLIVAGIALVENAWMPLLSLPGILVGMKWNLSGKASMSQYAGDGEQLEVFPARWKIVPFIY